MFALLLWFFAVAGDAIFVFSLALILASIQIVWSLMRLNLNDSKF